MLSQLLQQDPENTLWIADESSKALLSRGFTFSGDLLSNRWDVVKQALESGINAVFSDYELQQLPRQYARIVYPISKEKAIVNLIINQSPDLLIEGGELVLLGEKNSGLKTFAKKAAERFSCAKNLQKNGNNYLSVNTVNPGSQSQIMLDDSDYHTLRPLESLNGLYSKPGLYGWTKIDVGSALLASQFTNHPPVPKARVVDLGCGYGFLCAQLSQLGQFTFKATDNNAAALLACERNFSELGIEGKILAGDAGSELKKESAQYVICNPPFHRGFQIEGDLTDQFLKQAARILKPRGQALFVVNEFIPLLKKAAAFFGSVELLSKDDGFCVYRLTLPK